MEKNRENREKYFFSILDHDNVFVNLPSNTIK